MCSSQNRCFFLLLLFPFSVGRAVEWHVAVTGNDTHAGMQASPLRTLQRAADLAQPGDTVTVHAGIYRERVNPPRGGESDVKRITYQAAPGEDVEIRGSEVVKGWEKVRNETWKLVLPNAFFGTFNPFADEIKGDWFDPVKRVHHTGAVYLNGEWLTETDKQEEALAPAGESPLWFGHVDEKVTTLWAQFPGVDPNGALTEVNVRQTVFYPDKPGRNYITVRGFMLRHAATPWAPPTAEQIGLIGTHWSKGWVIENCTISHSICAGLTLGKYGDTHDNTAESAPGYVTTIEKALAFDIPWDKAHVGNHVVRSNRISHCEQAGIVGSMGASFSVVEGNVIHDIHVRKRFSGAEMAGIKFHGAVDTLIRGNRIYKTVRGLWLDWMTQGTRITCNLFYENVVEDVYMEVNHGPFVLDNNVMLSSLCLRDLSQGGAYAHNLFAGTIVSAQEPGRHTPYLSAHATAMAGLTNIVGGDNQYFNNVFVGTDRPPAKDRMEKGVRKGVNGYGLWVYDKRAFPLRTAGNVYVHGARPYTNETDCVQVPSGKVQFRVDATSGEVTIQLDFTQALRQAKTAPVDTEKLGRTKISGLIYQNHDGMPLRVDTDFFGKERSRQAPTPGPFETRTDAMIKLVREGGMP